MRKPAEGTGSQRVQVPNIWGARSQKHAGMRALALASLRFRADSGGCAASGNGLRLEVAPYP